MIMRNSRNCILGITNGHSTTNSSDKPRLSDKSLDNYTKDNICLKWFVIICFVLLLHEIKESKVQHLVNIRKIPNMSMIILDYNPKLLFYMLNK